MWGPDNLQPGSITQDDKNKFVELSVKFKKRKGKKNILFFRAD